jgi:hypothetical protein
VTQANGRREYDGLDHVLLNPALSGRLQEAGVDRETRGAEGASDHAPVWIKLRDRPELPVAAFRRTAGQTTIVAAPTSPRTRKSPPRTGERTRRSSRAAKVGEALSARPLLVIDGDSFAHRSYHALPKTIHRSDGKGAGAILGFANFLLRMYADEQPRAVLVGWDSLEAQTKRHQMFPTYQSGREFDSALIEQLKVLPEFVSACGVCKRQSRRL